MHTLIWLLTPVITLVGLWLAFPKQWAWTTGVGAAYMGDPVSKPPYEAGSVKCVTWHERYQWARKHGL